MLKKPYIKIIRDDLAPYLVSVTKMSNTNGHYEYTFNTKNRINTGNIPDAFKHFARSIKCWECIAPQTYTWVTKSTMLKDMFENNEILYPRRSAVVDIPNDNPCLEIFLREKAQDLPSDDMLDATRYMQEFKGTFLNDKETEMNKNKFKAVYSINISVNGNNFILTDPINPDKALEVVLALNARIQFLTGQLDSLRDINGNTDEVETDMISTDNITDVLTDEIDNIKEQINYINKNIEDAE